MGREEVTRFVEDSDCVLLLGTFMTDINLGIYTANLDLPKCIYSTSETLQISHHFYHGIPLSDFLPGLIASNPTPQVREIPIELSQRNAYYTSMGFAIPAALGACVAKPNHRVIAICGDGAFQMTGNELSTIIRNGFSPILLILDNHGYGTERFLHAGEWKYNEINPWNYHKLPEVYGGGRGYLVANEGEFAAALDQAWADTSCAQIIQAKLTEGDASRTLLRLAERLGQRLG